MVVEKSKVTGTTCQSSLELMFFLWCFWTHDGSHERNYETSLTTRVLQQLASHGLLDVEVTARGDIHIDDHHTNEDIGLAVGTVSGQNLILVSDVHQIQKSIINIDISTG